MADNLLACPFCGGAMEDRGYGAIHVDGKGCPLGDLAIDPAKWNQRSRSGGVAVKGLLQKIADEADMANNVIALNRDGGGQGRVKVATAMHRIAVDAKKALSTLSPAPEGEPVAWTSELELRRAKNGNAGRLYANQEPGEQFTIPLYASPPEPVEVTAAARDVMAERQRQVEAEGWTPEHDDQHDKGEMARAGAGYAYHAGLSDEQRAKGLPQGWPAGWAFSWWKPSDRRRDLVKAGALILAEIERLDRAALKREGK